MIKLSLNLVEVVRIKKIIVLGFVFVLLASIVYGVNVCVVVQYPDLTSDVECIDIEENADGYEVLEGTSLDLIWKYWDFYQSHTLCKIGDIGRDEDPCFGDHLDDDYWNLNLIDNNKWVHTSYGFDGPGGCSVHYCATQNNHIGLAYGYNEDGGVYPEMLNVKEINFYVDGDKESGTIKVGPDSKLEVKVELENLYSKETDVEIKDVLVTGILKDIDDGEDIEEDSDEFDLKPEKDKTAKLTFDIPLEVEEDEYELEILIEAEDDLGIKYEIEKEFEVEVDKKPHELEFYRAELQDDEIECSRETNIDIGIINLGTKDEDVVLELVSSELSLSIKKKITLSEGAFDKDNKFSGLMPIKIDDDIKEGTYTITVKAIYNDGNDEKKKSLNLVVKDCKDKNIEKKEKQEVTVEKEVETVTGHVIYQETSEDYTTLLIVLGEIVVIGVAVIIISIYIKKR